MRFKFFSITIFAVLFISLVLPQLVLARGLVPCGGTGEPKCNICHFFQLLQKIISGASISVLALAALFIVIGGIVILSSAGSPDRASEGKRMITYSIIGIVICFGAWIIINTVMNALVNQEKMPWPWNKIQCVSTQAPPPPPEEPTGEYCICEIPVYTTAARTIQLFTEIKGTDLNDAQNCKIKCVSGNAEAYCPDRTTATNPKLYCADQSDLENKETFCYKQEATTDSITGACFTNSSNCYNSILSNDDYARKCWLDDQLYCRCTDGLATWCTPSKPSGLYQIAKEVGVGGLFNAWTCVRNCGLSGGYCKLGSVAPPPPPPTTWRFQGDLSGTKNQQVADATTALTNFLDCFYQKAPSNIGYISAITDKDIYNGTCNPQDCKGDACTTNDCGPGKPCDHACHSCHYGGTCTTTESYAVDFGDEANVCQIADIATQCGGVNKIFGPQTCGGKVTVDGYHASHVHISVTNSCNCN